jgi:membrane protein involved in colicin uptake
MARINTIKAAAQKALDEKRMKLEAEEAVKKQKADALIAAESERKAAKAAEQEAGLARIKAQKAAEQEVMDNKKLAAQKLADEKRIKLEAEEAAKKQKEAARLAADEERKAFKAAKATEHESAQAKIRAQKLEAAVPTLAKGDPPGGKPLPNEEEKNAVDAVTASAVKQGKKGASVNREGMIKLNILNGSSDATHVATFEKSLREIPGIKVIMISGDNKEGVQIIVSSEDSVALSEILRQMPIVKEVADRQSDIMIRLQPLTVFKEL